MNPTYRRHSSANIRIPISPSLQDGFQNVWGLMKSTTLFKRNSSYLCILVDNEKRHLYDVPGPMNKHEPSLYFSKIPRAQRCRVKYVTIDMWEPYKAVSKIYFPNAVVSVDSFYVVKHLTQGFAQLRIDLMNQYYMVPPHTICSRNGTGSLWRI